ncbi:hypothetical protein [Emcibacter sp. SYSU 3D8]|uniref:hypothetical protein n=1 Tax=Emcibacter sp. SYSU 3D8 TaxID=3133969 RepID=UPI0031FF2D02
MANASRKTHGAGVKGKGDGSGAATQLPAGEIAENEVLSNRDKASRKTGRGQDGRWNQTENYHEHTANREPGSDQTVSKSRA